LDVQGGARAEEHDQIGVLDRLQRLALFAKVIAGAALVVVGGALEHLDRDGLAPPQPLKVCTAPYVPSASWGVHRSPPAAGRAPSVLPNAAVGIAPSATRAAGRAGARAF